MLSSSFQVQDDSKRLPTWTRITVVAGIVAVIVVFAVALSPKSQMARVNRSALLWKNKMAQQDGNSVELGCEAMCQHIGSKLKAPQANSIAKCKQDCRVDEPMYEIPSACNAACDKQCAALASNPGVCKGDCASWCEKDAILKKDDKISPYRKCAQRLRVILENNGNDAVLMMPWAQTVILSHEKEEGTVMKDSVSLDDLVAKAQTIGMHRNTQHKWLRSPNANIFLFDDNMVVTADLKACRLIGVYLPSGGELNPHIKGVIEKDVFVQQDYENCKSSNICACIRNINGREEVCARGGAGEVANLSCRDRCVGKFGVAEGRVGRCGCGNTCPPDC